MKRPLLIFNSLFAAGIFCGCAFFQKPVPQKNAPVLSADKLQMRNNSLSLLYDLLNDEKNVSKVLIIKRNSDELGGLIKAISVSSRDAQKQLDAMAKADPTLNLQALELPAGEKATRDSISKTKEHELLTSSGENFQFQLLLTQTDALSYGWHLAKIAAENSTRPEQIRGFNDIHATMHDLYDQAVALMRLTPPK